MFCFTALGQLKPSAVACLWFGERDAGANTSLCRGAFGMSQSCLPESLVVELSCMIAEARTRAAVAVNAEITALYWHVGMRIPYCLRTAERIELELISQHTELSCMRRKF